MGKIIIWFLIIVFAIAIIITLATQPETKEPLDITGEWYSETGTGKWIFTSDGRFDAGLNRTGSYSVIGSNRVELHYDSGGVKVIKVQKNYKDGQPFLRWSWEK